MESNPETLRTELIPVFVKHGLESWSYWHIYWSHCHISKKSEMSLLVRSTILLLTSKKERERKILPSNINTSPTVRWNLTAERLKYEKNMCILEWVNYYSLWIHNLIHINCCWLLKLWKDLTKLILIWLYYVFCRFYLSPLGLLFSSCFKLQADRSCDFPSWYLNTRESFIHWSPITSGISSSLFSIQGEASFLLGIFFLGFLWGNSKYFIYLY